MIVSESKSRKMYLVTNFFTRKNLSDNNAKQEYWIPLSVFKGYDLIWLSLMF